MNTPKCNRKCGAWEGGTGKICDECLADLSNVATIAKNAYLQYLLHGENHAGDMSLDEKTHPLWELDAP